MQNKYKLREKLTFNVSKKLKYIIDDNLRKKRKQNRAIIPLNYVVFCVTNKNERKL
jgi:hypothetical protein